MEAPLEIDHPAGMGRVGLHRHRDRLVLNRPPGAAVDRALPGAGGEAALVVEGQLLVIDRLARIERHSAGGGGAAVVLHLLPGQALRVLGVVLVELAEAQAELAGIVRIQGELGESLVEDGAAVVAIAVGLEVRAVEDKARLVIAAFNRHTGAAGAESRLRGVERYPRRALAIAREQLDHPAGVAAVDAGERAAQHLDALQAVQIEGRRLALAVGVGQRHAIGQQLDTANAEGRAGAEATRGHLQILRVVLPVLHHQAGHAAERLGQIDPRLA